jgi:hypothetical protein
MQPIQTLRGQTFKCTAARCAKFSVQFYSVTTAQKHAASYNHRVAILIENNELEHDNDSNIYICKRCNVSCSAPRTILDHFNSKTHQGIASSTCAVCRSGDHTTQNCPHFLEAITRWANTTADIAALQERLHCYYKGFCIADCDNTVTQDSVIHISNGRSQHHNLQIETILRISLPSKSETEDETGRIDQLILFKCLELERTIPAKALKMETFQSGHQTLQWDSDLHRLSPSHKLSLFLEGCYVTQRHCKDDSIFQNSEDLMTRQKMLDREMFYRLCSTDPDKALKLLQFMDFRTLRMPQPTVELLSSHQSENSLVDRYCKLWQRQRGSYYAVQIMMHRIAKYQYYEDNKLRLDQEISISKPSNRINDLRNFNSSAARLRCVNIMNGQLTEIMGKVGTKQARDKYRDDLQRQFTLSKDLLTADRTQEFLTQHTLIERQAGRTEKQFCKAATLFTVVDCNGCVIDRLLQYKRTKINGGTLSSHRIELNEKFDIERQSMVHLLQTYKAQGNCVRQCHLQHMIVTTQGRHECRVCGLLLSMCTRPADSAINHLQLPCADATDQQLHCDCRWCWQQWILNSFKRETPCNSVPPRSTKKQMTEAPKSIVF